jgi:hypothetical protein
MHCQTFRELTRKALGCGSLLMVLVLALSVRAVLADGETLPSIVARSGTYVLQFEQRFALVISAEQYEQHSSMGRSFRAPVDRKIESEMLFLWVAEDRAWLAVRNVLNVNGHPVRGREQRLDRLLTGAAPVRITRLRQLANESTRYNIGSVRRNFNDPMLALRFLEPDNQRLFKFALQGQETVDGSPVWKVAFEEIDSPTIIQDNGHDRPSRGMIWIAAEGVITRTRLEVGDQLSGYTAVIVVDYRRDPKLDMLVPTTMRESYINTSGPLGPVGDHIDCEAQYSKFRRFETAARIVPDP